VFGRPPAQAHEHRDRTQRVPLWVRAQGWLAPGLDAQGMVYGTITMGALLAAEDPASENFPKTLVSVVLALLAVWAAHTYAALTAHRLSRGRRQLWGNSTSAASGSDVDDGEVGVEDGAVAGGRAAGAPPSRAPRRAELWSLVKHELAVLEGGVLPLVALIVSWVAGASLRTAILVTLATCAGTLIATELLVGLRAAAGPAVLALQVLAGASLGLAVLALEVILH
jgi:hypothetical protein